MVQPLDFKSMQDEIQAALIASTRSVSLISSEDLAFQRSLNSEVGSALDEQSNRLLALSKKLLDSAASIAELRAPDLEDTDDVENNWRGVVDVLDSLLEKADGSLDEYTGVLRRTNSPSLEQAAATKKKNPYGLGSSFRTQNLLKPQLAFKTKPNNEEKAPWKPLLRTKPHAVLPLEQSHNTYTDELGHVLYRHPYEKEIVDLQYPSQVHQKAEAIPYLPVDTTSATFVDTYEGVLQMLEELKRANEIAIDLEHHDARSYVGLVSLMQISTREKDWIVDTLKPWREDLQVLNEVFANPRILKVFHGAYMDIVWLQRDLGLYVVGLFDTHHASRVLGYPGGSLAYLLKRFIDFDADKKYQLADWRIRPIPEEMFYYARADTHYLLYIYDNLRNELLEHNDPTKPGSDAMEMVLEKSKETSLLRFERQIYDADTGKGPGGWFSLLYKTPGLLSNQQFAVFRAVHGWRDIIARKDDDSTNVVMSNHTLFKLAKEMPDQTPALYAAVHPISHNVKTRTGELLELIKSAKESGAAPNAPNMIDILKAESKTHSQPNGHLSQAHQAPSTVSKIVDPGLLRTTTSQFWGGTFGSSIWDHDQQTVSASNFRLAVPMPTVAADAFSDSSHLAFRDPVSTPEPISEYPAPAKVQEDEVFNIKSGRKRKSEDMPSEPLPAVPAGAEEYDISLNDDEEEALAAKSARKAAKKVAKRAAKVEKTSSGASTPRSTAINEQNVDDEEEAFDYSKAESVLHSKRQDNGGGKKKGKGGKKDPFDPYQKSQDSAKGARRLQTERAGKSHTFRN